jgi:transcriptional regulator with XRE-family HTH domain
VVAWALVKQMRERAGLTQRQLAERAGKAQSEIARIERGRQDPSLTTLQRLARAAGFDLRIQLRPHDDHDEVLIDAMLDLSVDERLQQLEDWSEAFATARVIDDRSG